MKITEQMLEKLEKLSALSVAEDKREEFKAQLGEIVNFVEILNELDLDNIDATISTIKSATPFREDEPKECNISKDVLAHAPKHSGNYFEVPKIMD